MGGASLLSDKARVSEGSLCTPRVTLPTRCFPVSPSEFPGVLTCKGPSPGLSEQGGVGVRVPPKEGAALSRLVPPRGFCTAQGTQELGAVRAAGLG